MGGVRARKTRRNKIMNNTKIAQKRKKKGKKIPQIANKTIKANWNKDKTLKQNLKNLGLAFDPNEAIPFKKDKKKQERMSEESSPMEIEKTVKESKVVQELEKEAAVTSKLERHISPGEAQFLLAMINDYGSNYKAMAKDKRNYNQHTPKQMKRKCESFLSSSYYSKYSKKEQRMEME